MSRSIRGRLRAALIVMLGLGGAGCATSEFSGGSPPPGGVIQDEVAAIAVAHAMWASMHPEMPIAPLPEWQRTMIAHLDRGVWRINERPLGPGSMGGSCEIDLSAMDGRLLQSFARSDRKQEQSRP